MGENVGFSEVDIYVALVIVVNHRRLLHCDAMLKKKFLMLGNHSTMKI